ncbi:MAG TPA: hypothetical protein VME17_25905, partial [Bryobacteraceae bacterium]|nr:hypothetical protein [Bryobacteraceae bacterium]
LCPDRAGCASVRIMDGGWVRNMTRWLLLGGVVGLLSSAAWAQTGTFTIELDGFDDNQVFDGTANPANLDTSDFTNPDDFCVGLGLCGDPNIKVDTGGDATDITGSDIPDITSGPTGTNTNAYQNDSGTPIDSILIMLTSNDGYLNMDQYTEVFTCSSDIFQYCGFNNDAFEVAFWDPINNDGVGIPTATPEPSEWIFLLIAAAAIVVARWRKNALNSTFARTQR